MNCNHDRVFIYNIFVNISLKPAINARIETMQPMRKLKNLSLRKGKK